MILQAAYQLTIKDFEEAQIQHGGWKRRLIPIGGGVLMFSGLADLAFQTWFLGVFVFLWGGFLLFGTRILRHRAFKKEPSLQLETKTTVSDDGLLFTTSTAESKLNWTAFIRYTAARNVFVLYVQSRLIYIIPKRAFAPEDVVTLREMFSSRISATSPNAGRASTQALLFAFVVITAIVLVYFAIRANRG